MTVKIHAIFPFFLIFAGDSLGVQTNRKNPKSPKICSNTPIQSQYMILGHSDRYCAFQSKAFFYALPPTRNSRGFWRFFKNVANVLVGEIQWIPGRAQRGRKFSRGGNLVDFGLRRRRLLGFALNREGIIVDFRPRAARPKIFSWGKSSGFRAARSPAENFLVGEIQWIFDHFKKIIQWWGGA